MQRTSDTIPFRPNRWPFFYGWAILFWGIMGVLISAPGQTTGVSAFIEPLITALEISRTELSLAYMVGTLGSAMLLTPAGVLFDRVGARWMGFGSCVMLGGVLILLSCTAQLHGMLASFFPARESMIVLLALLFLLLRFSGQGVLAMSARNMIMKWFDRHRGLVSGITGAAVSFGFSITPTVFSGQISLHGWSGTWFWLGLILMILFAPLFLLFFRDNPESCGLLPDGRLPAKAGEPEIKEQRSFSLKEALCTYAFWPFALTMALQALAITAITFNIESIFETAGLKGADGFALFPPMAITAICITLVGGWMADRLELRWLLLTMLAAMSLQITGLMLLAPGGPTYLIIIFGGIGNGLFGVLMNIVWPRYYGRAHLGAINGFSMMLMSAASAVGPWLFSILLGASGGYRWSLSTCLTIALILLASAFFVRKPQVETIDADDEG